MQRYQRFFVIAILAILLINNHSIPLWDQDEAAYAGFGFNMNESGNYLVPDFMYSDVHRKPPLHFWNIALSYKLFGYNEFAVRFPAFLAILGTILLMYYQGKKFLGKNKAFLGVLVIAGSLLVPTLSKISVTDGTLLFFSTLSAFGIINTLRTPNWQWVFLFWLGFALGILTKGPPIIIFTGAFVGILFLVHPKRMNLLKLHPWFFLPLALAPAFIWGYFTYLNDGGVFLKWMYDWYVLERINGAVFGQTGPIGTHLLGLCAFFMFFLMFIPRALGEMGKGMFQKNETATLLFSWFLAGWLLYEFSPSKLPTYVIAAHVPLAFMIAFQIEKGFPFKTIFDKLVTSLHFILQFSIGIALCLVPFFFQFPSNMWPFIVVLGLLLIGINLFILIKREHQKLYLLQLAGGIIFILTVWLIAPFLTPILSSSKQVASAIVSKNVGVKQVFIGHNFGEQPSLPFYLLKNGCQPIDVTQFSKEELVKAYTKKPQSFFVLNQEKYDFFCQTLGKTLPYQSVSTFIIDRKGKSDYYIVPANP